MPPENSGGGASRRTAEDKKQDHIKAIKEMVAEDIGPMIEESIHRSVDDYAASHVAPNGNDESRPSPQQATEKFMSLVPRPTFDDLWTQRDEEHLVHEVEKDTEFQHRCTYQDYISETWKIAYKFMGCLATDIVGPKSYLMFYDRHATSRTRFWASRFCRKLSNLIVQPVFAANPRRLSLAIQWSVICRTGDRRKWRLSGCGEEDDFLRILEEVVEQSQDGTQSPQSLRLVALGLFNSRYPTRRGDDPLWCQFLQRIEEQALETTRAAVQGRDSQDFGDFELYRVNTTDLTNLLDAIREVRVCGFPMFHDPSTVAMTVLYARDPVDIPLRPQIVEATKAVLLSHRREAKRAQKLRTPDIRGSSALSQLGEAQGDADEKQDSGSLEAGLNLPDQRPGELEAGIAGKKPDEHSEEGPHKQTTAPEMGRNTQEATGGIATRGASSSGGELEDSGKNAPPGEVLGKRPRDLEDVGLSRRAKMPLLQPDERRVTGNTSGVITGSTPTNPRADPSNTAMKNPFGSGVMFQAEPLTQRGSNMMNRLLEGAAIGSSTGRVHGTLTAAEDIGLSNNLERIGFSTAGMPAETLPVHLMMQNQNQNQNQNRPQNQIQDRPQSRNQNRPQIQNQNSVQPALCVLCDSTIHCTGECPMPSSFHHGDTAVCGMHNTTNKYPRRGHIFDCSVTRPQSTCDLVTEKQNGIRRRDANEKEHWEFLIRWLVVERQHKAPIRVEHHTLDFVDLVLDYANDYCDGEMPQQVNFTWPYTKAEARRYEASLRRYDELGPDQMPVGMLDGKSILEIKAMRDRGEIPMQVYKPSDPPATNPN